jgi:hypothetical protein
MKKILLTLSVFIAMAADPVLAQYMHYTGPQCASSCPGDVGPKADTARVRAAMLKEMHGPRLYLAHMDVVHVAGNYAVISEYPPGGAFAFKRVSDEGWKIITDASGNVANVFSVNSLVQVGIPASIAKQLCSGWPKGRSWC